MQTIHDGSGDEGRLSNAVRSGLLGVVLGASVNVLLVLATWAWDGAGVAARCATSLVMPMGLIWTFTLVASIVCWKAGSRRISYTFAILFLLISIAGNGRIASKSIGLIEWPRTNWQQMPTPFRTVVVLGGGVSVAHDGVPELNSAGQRTMLTAQIWHAGKTQSIICTGTSPTGPLDPSAAGSMLLQSVAVPVDKIYEIPGDNTSQEMQSLAAMLDSPPESFPRTGKIGVVTSAFHMSRAMRLAAANQLDVVPLPSGYGSLADRDYSPKDIVPSAESMEKLSLALKERLARLVKR